MIRSKIRFVYNKIKPLGMAACVRLPWLANVYYCLDRSFEKEHAAVLAGQLNYRRSVNGASATAHEYRLRRNIHRLEKGLISRPRREIFARQYIKETIVSFETVMRKPVADTQDLLLRWATDVLGAYFEVNVAGKDKVIDDCREIYGKLLLQSQEMLVCDSGAAKAPYTREDKKIQVGIDEMLELSIRRRSVRWYLDRPVARDMIDAAIEVAGYSPSACNRQPYKFRIFDDPSRIQELAQIPMGTRGFSHQFPVFIVIVGSLEAYPFARDRHVIYIDASLAAMSLQFALEAQGLSSCCINWPDVATKEKAMAQAIGLGADERVVMCMSVGYPDPSGMVPYSQKKTVNELRSYNK